MPVAQNIAKIEERIQRACENAGRKRDEISLMAVSKFVPLDLIEEAFGAGIRLFGESRVKEAAAKLETFRKGHSQAGLHLIGSLQRNKAKQAALFFDCVQSVDRLELVTELAKYAPEREKPLEIFLELHTGEMSKSGFENLDGLFEAAQMVCGCAYLKPAGLMTMAPFTEDTRLIRASFRALARAREELEKRFPKENWHCLSMGMSNDFEIAVEEGSNLLRIGSAIFKE
jgi:pyridoxal phosphate enzyme (YggS family)